MLPLNPGSVDLCFKFALFGHALVAMLEECYDLFLGEPAFSGRFSIDMLKAVSGVMLNDEGDDAFYSFVIISSSVLNTTSSSFLSVNLSMNGFIFF